MSGFLAKAVALGTGIDIKAILGFVVKQLPIIIVIGVLTYFVLDYTKTKANQATLTANYDTLSKAHKELNDTFEEFKGNQTNLNKSFGAKAALSQHQTKIRGEIGNVQVKGSDRPFVDDPGLRERVDRMRNYQESSPVYSVQ